jgi:phosphoglycerate dehydrogenase-like enzyme
LARKLLLVLHHRFALWQAPRWFSERLQSDFPQFDVVHLSSYDRVPEEIPEAEVFVGWSLRPEQFVTAKKLRWMHSTAAAVHQLLFPEMIASPVVLTNSRDVHGSVVAEHAITLILAMAKRLPSIMRHQARHEWAQGTVWEEHPRPREVAGGTVGLVGFGSIGREVASRARALGMRVLAVREHADRRAENVDEVFGPEAIDRMLEQADYVVLAAPLTEQTHHIINTERIAHMKPDAYLINVSRGPLVDEAALVEALRANRIGGAALDVFDREPLPPDSPFWDLPNVLVTPHTAAVTGRLWERHYDLLARNIRRYLAGEPLLNVVDKQKGY